MRKVKFTGKTGAKHMCFMEEDNKSLHCAYYSMVETTDGQMVTIKDESSPFGLLEDKTRYKAVKKAKEFLDRVGIE